MFYKEHWRNAKNDKDIAYQFLKSNEKFVNLYAKYLVSGKIINVDIDIDMFSKNELDKECMVLKQQQKNNTIQFFIQT